MANNCSSCGGCRGYNNGCSSCNSCNSGAYARSGCSNGCGTLRYLGWDGCSRANSCCGCRPYESVFYTGACPGCNSCNNCNSCNSCSGWNNWNNWNGCNSCSGCSGGWRRGAAAGFVAMAPQCQCAGGAFTFTADHVGCDSFAVCQGGIRILRAGTYAVMYSFCAPALCNTATLLSLHCGGSEIYSSRCSLEPATCGNTRSASGHALVCANAGDVLSLNSSCAMDITESACGSPVATLMIYAVD